MEARRVCVQSAVQGKYPEFTVASQLLHDLPTSAGYPIFVPASPQQKDVDFLVTHRMQRVTRGMSVQVESSWTYFRERVSRFRCYTRYNDFEAPPKAGFVFLIALYPNEDRRRDRAIESSWSQLVLAFSHVEVVEFYGR